jgi:protein O-GlcNAc transferase
MTVPGMFEQAVEHHRGGRWAEAERLYRQVLSRDPKDAKALFLSGAIALQSGRVPDAVELFRRASQVDPANALCHANLGECHRRLGRPAEAMDAFLTALTLRPDLAEPMFNLGLLMKDHGEIELAVLCFASADELKPNVQEIRRQLAAARKEREVHAQAAGPDGRPSRASLSAQLLAGVGATLGAQGRHEAAIGICRRALELDPRCANAHHNLGAELLEQWQIDEAVASFRMALDADPILSEAHCNLGNALFRSGRIGEAIASYRRSLDSRPSPGVHSNILFSLPFHPGSDAAAILDEARAWNRLYAEPVAARRLPHSSDRAPERRLRIGYVSPDFRTHCQTFFTVPLLSHHDHQAHEIFCYADVAHPDASTTRLRGHADVWRSTVGMTDSELAAQVSADRIDILVDLTMHMERNRLLVFAQKPAPLQVAWLAYPGTTGLTAMDYRVTDPYLDPLGSDVSVYSERSIWLPDAFWCYDPLTRDPSVGPLPARSNGCITFACLNNFAKINEPILALWARILREVERSRLVVLAPEGESRERTRQSLIGHGVGADQVEFVGRRSRAQYLASYDRIDVGLDTFPSNGHTTSLDALWMGVPVVTLVGKTIVGRAGLCQAKNLGMDELIARTPDEYARIAVDLGKDLDRLSELRAGLRARMERSPLMDGARFARSMEAAYRKIWRRWCEGEVPVQQVVDLPV